MITSYCNKSMASLLVAIMLSMTILLTIAVNNNSLAQNSHTALSTGVINHLSNSNAHNTSAAELSYDTQNMTHRSAKEEWQPHRGQTAISQEWWYFTALLHDASGNRYMLFTTVFKFDGIETPVIKSVPKVAAMLGPNATVISPTVELSNYDTGFHYYDEDFAIVHPKVIWDGKSNNLNYKTPHYTGSWRFDGENMTAVLKSQKSVI